MCLYSLSVNKWHLYWFNEIHPVSLSVRLICFHWLFGKIFCYYVSLIIKTKIYFRQRASIHVLCLSIVHLTDHSKVYSIFISFSFSKVMSSLLFLVSPLWIYIYYMSYVICTCCFVSISIFVFVLAGPSSSGNPIRLQSSLWPNTEMPILHTISHHLNHRIQHSFYCYYVEGNVVCRQSLYNSCSSHQSFICKVNNHLLPGRMKCIIIYWKFCNLFSCQIYYNSIMGYYNYKMRSTGSYVRLVATWRYAVFFQPHP